MTERDDFYIGYAPVPPSVKRFLLWFVPVLVIGILALAAIVPSVHFGQANPGKFTGGQTFDGFLLAEPSPHLLVPNTGDQAEAASDNSPFKVYPLAGTDKRSPNPKVMQHVGNWVSVKGLLVSRGNFEMVLAQSAELIDVPDGTSQLPDQTLSLGEFSLAGEILDGKCYPGVMKPGHTKTHRACAIRCISGGVPPIFLVHNNQGENLYFLLSDLAGQAVNDRVLNMVADPIEITGEVIQYGDSFILKSDPASYKRIG